LEENGGYHLLNRSLLFTRHNHKKTLRNQSASLHTGVLQRQGSESWLQKTGENNDNSNRDKISKQTNEILNYSTKKQQHKKTITDEKN